jgi:diaminohydroxyphosphoribosylaminopyrimidine deaminase/5-amino-6-(5-phosphoribosylamino)uracil reductase
MKIDKEIHKKYMNIAIKLAEKARGKTSPNPMVGAVLVKDGKIIGEGYHKRKGANHAEVEAINSCQSSSEGATMYVTLEPCCFYGNTPPCTKTILKARIKKVIVGIIDPNPKVNCKGIKELKKSGVNVEFGFLENEISRQNETYIKYITKKIPFVTMKMAVSLDGKMCTKKGDSKWISSDISRRYVHKKRSQYDSVLTGIGTVLTDDPLLTSRYGKDRKNPIRIVVDSKLKIPLNSKLFNTIDEARLIIATTKYHNEKKANEIKKIGGEILVVESHIKYKKQENKEQYYRVNLNKLLEMLGEIEVTSVLVEAGSTLSTSFIKQDLVDKFLIFIAPIIIGGNESFQTIGDLGIEKIMDINRLNISNLERMGNDILIEAYPTK